MRKMLSILPVTLLAACGAGEPASGGADPARPPDAPDPSPWDGRLNRLGGNDPVRHSSGPFSNNAVNYHGGRVLANVQVDALFWGVLNLAQSVRNGIPSFYQAMTNSYNIDWFSEYNTNINDVNGNPGTNQLIGRGALRDNRNIFPQNTSTSLSDLDIQTELGTQIDLGRVLAPTANNVYMLHFPKGVQITYRGLQSCVPGGFCAYHSSFSHNGQQVTYAVLPDESPGSGCDMGCGGSTQFNNQTAIAAHELAEAIVDPDFKQAWWDPVNDEIGDLCNHKQAPLAGTGYVTQKEWSNLAGGCVTSGPQAGVMYTPGDFNGDGLTDLVITTSSGSYWYFNQGNGNWTVPYTRPDLPVGSVALVPGDFNGDGKTDLIITNASGSIWYFSHGDGNWDTPYTRNDLPLGAATFTTGDFDGNGQTDMVITNAAGSTWYLSQGNGNWTTPTTRTAAAQLRGLRAGRLQRRPQDGPHHHHVERLVLVLLQRGRVVLPALRPLGPAPGHGQLHHRRLQRRRHERHDHHRSL